MPPLFCLPSSQISPTTKGSSPRAETTTPRSAHHASSSPPPPRGGRAPRRRPPAPRRHGAGGDRARGGVQLRPRRRARAGALGRDQGGVGGVRRGADAVAHRPPSRARLAGARSRLPRPLLPPCPGLHRQPRPRHHGEVRGRRREPGDQWHGVPPEAAALALPHRAHRRRPPVRPGAAPGARERREEGRRHRHPLRDRPRPRPASSPDGALHPADRRQAGPGGARQCGGPPRRARQGQRVLPLHGLPHRAALHRGGHLDHRQEGSHRVQVPIGASQGSRARRHGEEREATSGGEQQRRQPLPA